MYDYFDKRSGQRASLIAHDVYEIIMKVLPKVFVCYKLQIGPLVSVGSLKVYT